jgi:hypothetical protein
VFVKTGSFLMQTDVLVNIRRSDNITSLQAITYQGYNNVSLQQHLGYSREAEITEIAVLCICSSKKSSKSRLLSIPRDMHVYLIMIIMNNSRRGRTIEAGKRQGASLNSIWRDLELQ